MELALTEAFLDRLAHRLRGWTVPRPLVIALQVAFGATVLVGIVVPETRRVFAELLWTAYLLWQAFVLARSKSLSWVACSGFVVAGALVAGPIAAFAPSLLKEPLKLLPVAAFLAGTARSRSLGVADVALAGFATGAGFGLLEESLRALALDDAGTGAVAALFPSPFETVSGRGYAGHAVTTGLVALGVGFALRFAPRWGRPVWMLPAALLAGAIFDHAVYNAVDLPEWLLRAHQRLGAGTGARPLLIAGLAGAVALDYRDLRRLRGLPLLPDGGRVGPIAEFVAEVRAAACGVRPWAETCAYVRMRHQLGFALLDARRAPGWGDLRPFAGPVLDPYALVSYRSRLVMLLAGAAAGGASVGRPRALSAMVDAGLQRIPRLRSALTRSARRELARRDPDALRVRRGVTATRDAEILRENREDILGVTAPKGWRTYRLVSLQGPGMPLNHEVNGVELPHPPSEDDRRRIAERLEFATSAKEAVAILREEGTRLTHGLPP